VRNAISATPSDVSSVDERHQHHPVLEPTPPLPTQSPVMAASGFAMTMPVTPTKGGDADESDRQEVGRKEAERNKFNAFRNYW